MKNAKKSISLAMVAIFTTFVMLSGIPVSAATSSAVAKKQISVATTYVVKAETIVKVSTFVVKTAQTSVNSAKVQVKKIASYGKTYTANYNALTKRLATVQTKINARAKAIATAAAATAVKTVAEKAVTKAEALTNTDTYDLVGSATDLANAQDAITASLDAVTKLNKDSADYKGLMARVDAANAKIVKAMDEIDANTAAADDVKLQATAEAAVVAVEAAPLATNADIKTVTDLGKTAATAVAAVKDADKVASFTARLKVVADKIVALQTPAKVVTVSAVDGTITVTFDKNVLTTMAAVDFKVTKSVGGATAVAVTPSAVTVTGTAVTLTVPTTVATVADQSVVYSVAYTTGSPITATCTVAKLGAPAITASSNKTFTAKFAAAVVDTTKVVLTVKRDSVVVPVTTTWDTTNTMATLTYGGVLPESTYTVNTTVNAVDYGTATISIVKQKVATINIIGTTLSIGANRGLTSNLPGDGFVTYQVLDQYGVDISSSALANSSIIWSTSVGDTTSVPAKNGLITVRSYSNSVFLTQYTTAVITGVCSDSAVSATKTLNVSVTQGTISDIKLNSVTNVDNKSVVGNDTINRFYVDYTATDMNGNPTKDKNLLANGILFNTSLGATDIFSSNQTVLTAKFDVDPNDSNKYVILITVHSTDMYADTPVTLTVMTKSGKSASITVNVKKPATLDTLSIMAPAQEVAAGDTNITIPYVAYDQNGNALTAYSDIVGDGTLVTSWGNLVPSKNADGTLKITTGSFAFLKGVTNVFQVVTKTGKNSMITIKADEAQAGNDLAVDSTVVKPYMQVGAVQSLDFGASYGGLTAYDQYGRAMDVTNQTTDNYYVVATAGDGTIVSASSNEAYMGNRIDITANAYGTQTITFKLMAKGNATPIATKTITIQVVKNTDIATIAIDSIPTMYATLTGDGSGDNSRTKDWNSGVSDQYVWGKLSNGGLVALNSDTYATILKFTDNSKFVISAADGSIRAQKLDTGVAEANGNLNASLSLNGTLMTASTPLKSLSATPVAASAGISVTTCTSDVLTGSAPTGFKVSGDTVTGTLNAINQLQSKSMFRYDNLGSSASRANVYFYGKDQYGRKSMTIPYFRVIDQTRAAGSAATYAVDSSTGKLLVTGTVTVGDTFTISAVTNNNLSKTMKFVVAANPTGTPAIVDKTGLASELAVANTAINGAVEGPLAGNYATGSIAIFRAVINSAIAEMSNASSTDGSVANMLLTLTTAVSTFNGQMVTAGSISAADSLAAGSVDTLIAGLQQTAASVTIAADQVGITAAYAAYNNLTATQKALVLPANLVVLNADVVALTLLVNAANADAAAKSLYNEVGMTTLKTTVVQSDINAAVVTINLMATGAAKTALLAKTTAATKLLVEKAKVVAITVAKAALVNDVINPVPTLSSTFTGTVTAIGGAAPSTTYLTLTGSVLTLKATNVTAADINTDATVTVSNGTESVDVAVVVTIAHQ